MAFVQQMRTATITLHTAQQLRGDVAPRGRPTFHGFMKYMAEQRHVHHALRETFPVRTKADFVGALDTDLFFLELEAWHADLPLIIPTTYKSDYAAFLYTLPAHRVGCHWYNLVFAHLVGGNKAVASAAAEVLPKNWIESSEFFSRIDRDEVDALRDAFEAHAQLWTPEQRDECLGETKRAFSKVGDMNGVMFAKQ